VGIQQVILVDDNDNAIGEVEKMEAHLKGLKHRAFSIFIFNSSGEMLLQQRALNKYHSAGLWSNACCSHPRPGEKTELAAARRVSEELGFTTPLQKIFDFAYKVSFANGLIEHEFDHVFVGNYDGVVSADPAEVNDWSFKSIEEIKKGLREEPGKYTEWFQIAFPKIEAWWKQRYGVNE
jgi:isopentenyl-diphosphate delta-isomerase